MKAIILAAGVGKRLGALHQGPKCLLEFAGRNLLGRHLDTLAALGVDSVTLCLGHASAAIERSIPQRHVARVLFHYNPLYELGSVVSLWCARHTLLGGDDGGIFALDESAARDAVASLERTRAERDADRANAAIEALQAAARDGSSMMEASIECALARVTTGEWAGALREVFGEFRPATGVEGQQLGLAGDRVEQLRTRVGALADTLGHRPRIVVGKPGLDGHSNGAEVIAVSARHVGFDVIYSGIRLSPVEIVLSAVEEDADVIGASVLSGSHVELAEQIFDKLTEHGAAGRIDVVFGGIIPQAGTHDIARAQSATTFSLVSRTL